MSAASPRNESAALPQNAAHRFERDVIPFTPTLFSHALRLTRHRPDAEDLLQDTLLRAYRGFNTFEPGTNLRAWLFRIQTNSFISGWQRRQRRGSEVNLCEEIQFADIGMDSTFASGHLESAEEQVLRAMPDLRIASAMWSLPLNFRTVLYYADIVGLSVKDIAALTNSPAGTVMSRLHRARLRLRACLSEQCQETTTAPRASTEALTPQDNNGRIKPPIATYRKDTKSWN